MYKKMNMGVVGCGVIGGSLANLLESLGHTVKRYDPAKNLIDNISDCDIIFICVPTKPDMQFEDIKKAVFHTHLKNKKGIIAIRSTLMPGMIDEFAKEYNRDFVYLPEFLRERSALEDEIKPDKVIIGTNKMETFRLFESIFEPIIANEKILMMKPVEAELVKVALNSLYTVKVVFGNELYDICQKYGADYYRLFEAFKLDKYINPMHLDPLFDGYRGAGGKCLPKDIKFLIKAGLDKKYFPHLMFKADQENEDLLEKGGDKMEKIINKVIERYINCPYFQDCEGRIYCTFNLCKHIERKDFEIIKKGFPDWCPLKDFEIEIKIKKAMQGVIKKGKENEWLNTPNEELNDDTPLEAISRGLEGVKDVLELLHRIEYGIPI